MLRQVFAFAYDRPMGWLWLWAHQEWVQMILDFVARVAWPGLVLVLALTFKGPVSRALARLDINEMKATVAGVEMSMLFNKKVSSATRKIEQDPPAASSPGAGTPERKDINSTNPSKNSTRRDPVETTPLPRPRTENLKIKISSIPDYIKNLIEADPQTAVRESAMHLSEGLSSALNTLHPDDTRWRPRDPELPRGLSYRPILEAGDSGLLSDSELSAADDLVAAFKLINTNPRTILVEPSVAMAYARTATALVNVAESRARNHVENNRA